MSKLDHIKNHLLEECYEPPAVVSAFIQEVNDSKLGKAANEAMQAADDAERKASTLRDAATTAFTAVIEDIEARVAEMKENDFEEEEIEGIKEATSGAVHLYAGNAGMSVEYEFGEEVQMWEASTC